MDDAPRRSKVGEILAHELPSSIRYYFLDCVVVLILDQGEKRLDFVKGVRFILEKSNKCKRIKLVNNCQEVIESRDRSRIDGSDKIHVKAVKRRDGRQKMTRKR